MKLTKNEKEVLKLLLDNGRISDIDMASKLKISTQAVGKIRKKLEDNGVIEGYSCNLNFEKLGLNNFALVLAKIKDKYWEKFGEVGGVEEIRKAPQAIFSCMPSGSDISLISLHCFKDAKEADRFFHLAKTRYSENHEIITTYPFSTLNLLCNSPKELFKLILNDKPIVPTFPRENNKKL